MIIILMFYLICIFTLFACLSSSVNKRKSLENYLKDIECSNEVLQERVKYLESERHHLKYVVEEKNEDIDKYLSDIIELNTKLKTKKRK